MRWLFIVVAALGLLAGEPAVAAPTPPPDLPVLNFSLIPGLLQRFGQQVESSSESAP
jgi:hypothetical protein